MLYKLLVLILLFSNAGLLAQSPPLDVKHRVLIEQGTILKVQSQSSIKSNRVEEGDELEFLVYEDLFVNNTLVIKEGTLVKAYVESVEKSKSLGKEGYLKIQFTSTRAVDNTVIPLRSFGAIAGEDKLTASIAMSVVLSPLFLLKKGTQAKVNEGKVMKAYVYKDTFLTQ
jgi:hypothetical protein